MLEVIDPASPITTYNIALLSAFGEAIGVIANPVNIALIVLATLFGFMMGVIPGMGGVTALALLVPLTFGMDPLVAFMLLAAAYSGVNFGGSVTSILINTPGASPNAATLLDGYPMTRNGEAGRAIGASATASAIGAVIGIIALIISIPIIQQVILLFGPPEIFWLGVWGITIIAVVVKGSIIAGLVGACIGALVAMHGQNPMTGQFRWFYDISFLQAGIGLIPVLIGLFALTEMIKLSAESGGKQGSIADGGVIMDGSGRFQGVIDTFRNKWLIVRCSIIGTVIGVIPGVGGVLANFFSYFHAAQTEKNAESFGSGDVRGVISSESSNDASANGGYLPTLGFGIPGSIAMVVILGAFVLHGIQPGPLIFDQHMNIVAVIIVTSLIGNVVVSMFGLATLKPLVRLATIDVRYIVPMVIMTVFLAAFAIQNNVYNVFITMFFGIFGYGLWKAGISPIPIVLAMVLTPIVERNYFRSLQIGGDHFYFVDSIISKILILMILVSLLLPLVQKRMEEVANE